MRRLVGVILTAILISGGLVYARDAGEAKANSGSHHEYVKNPDPVSSKGIRVEKGKKRKLTYVLLAGGAVTLGVGAYLLLRKGQTLSEGTVKVHVNSRPSGATLYVDGEEIGRTPLDFKVKAGKHRLKLVKELVGEAEREINFKAGKVYTINVTLSGYTYELVLKWGRKGSGDGEFYNPSGVAVDDKGYVYVVDSGNYRVQKFTREGKFVAKWGRFGSGEGEFRDPSGIAVDNKGYVYVVDTLNNCVQKFTSEGIFVKKWGGKGSGVGEFDKPQGIAIDDDGFVYVADSENERIQKFTSEGVYVTSLKKAENLWVPLDVSVDPRNGYIYVAAYYLDKFSRNGKFLQTIAFVRPWWVTVDGNGYIYTSDFTHAVITKISPEGFFITDWGGRGSEDGKFVGPNGIAVDRNGYVYVADSGNNRIQKFAITGNTPGNGDWEVSETSYASAGARTRRHLKKQVGSGYLREVHPPKRAIRK